MSTTSVAGASEPDTSATLSRRRTSRRVGLALSTLAVLFLLFDAGVKLVGGQMVVEANAQLGYAASMIVPIATIELVLLALYLIPRTAVLGAILWTGYLGGALASQARVGNPLFSNVLFPIYIAALLWGGLWLRDGRARALLSAPARK